MSGYSYIEIASSKITQTVLFKERFKTLCFIGGIKLCIFLFKSKCITIIIKDTQMFSR